MALKDWKKDLNLEHVISWEKGKYPNYLVVDIQKSPYHKYKWYLTIDKNGNQISQKLYSSKSQALKYAKSYMRKH
ncbi:MAG: hypothetical protein ACOCV1_01630 [Bacillota bacterium]